MFTRERLISSIAYDDDLNIIAESEESRDKLMNIVREFCKETGFDLNVTKTISTSTKLITQPIHWTTLDDNREMTINSCNKNQANRFLGLWTALDLNWEEQKKLLQQNLNRNLI